MSSHVAASTVCAAHTDASGSMCSLSASSTQPGQISVCRTPTVPPIDAASMVCAALMDPPGSVRSLPATSTPSAQISVGGTPTVPSHVAASMVCVAHMDTSGSVCSRYRLPRRRKLSCSVGWTPTVPSHATASTVCALRAHGHFRRLRALAVGFPDAASSDFGRRDAYRAVKRRFIDGHRAGTSIGGPSCVTDQLSL